MMSFIPSCDHREDAVRSLSEIYAVSHTFLGNGLVIPREDIVALVDVR